MHAVTGVGQVQKAVIDATLENDIGETMEGDKAAGGTNGGEGKRVIQTTIVTIRPDCSDPSSWQRRPLQAAAVDVTSHGDSTSLLGQKSAAAEDSFAWRRCSYMWIDYRREK
jgi:hypothetical protein